LISRIFPLAVLALASFLTGCGDSGAEVQAQQQLDPIKNPIYAQMEEDIKLDQQGQAEAIALHDDKIIELLGQCRSLVFDQANKDFRGSIAMVEKESAAQFIVAAGTAAVRSLPERVSILRKVQEANFPVIQLNTSFAVVYGTTGRAPQVQAYRCLLGPGPVVRAAEKYTPRV